MNLFSNLLCFFKIIFIIFFDTLYSMLCACDSNLQLKDHVMAARTKKEGHGRGGDGDGDGNVIVFSSVKQQKKPALLYPSGEPEQAL